ncbi:hypothetical protein K3495_g15826, partial [Podosphaera aphanis]
MDEGFETEISLIQDKDPPLTFDQIHRRLKTKETSLETPPKSINAARRQPLTGSTNNNRPINDPSICFGCKIPFSQLPNNHRRVVCKIYLSTPEGEAWKKKSFYTDKKIAYEKMFGAIKDNMASANANVRVNVAKGLVNRYSHDSDAYSSSESIASGYLCVASINSEPSETKKSQLENSTKLSWLLDTAASQHITNRKDVFEKSIQSSNQQITVANGQMIQAQGIGSILIPWESNQAKAKLLRIRDVLYVPQASENLLSLGQLNKNGISFRTDKNGIILEKNNKLWARGTRYHRIYHLNQPHMFQKAFSTAVITEKLMK